MRGFGFGFEETKVKIESFVKEGVLEEYGGVFNG